MTETLRNGKKKAVLEALRQGHTRRAACRLVGISYQSLYNWLCDDLTLLDAVEKAEAEAERYYLDVIREAAKENWQAAAWYLERRRRDDYGRNETLNVLQKTQREIEKLSDEDLARLVYGSPAGDEAAPGEA